MIISSNKEKNKSDCKSIIDKIRNKIKKHYVEKKIIGFAKTEL